jgi:hypothetical protein
MAKKYEKVKNKMRRGRATDEEVKFVVDNLDNMEIEDIAKTLNRSIQFVKDRIAQAPQLVEDEVVSETVAKLHKSYFWLEIRRTLLKSEVPFFERQWAKLIDQFSTNEILATDEMMIKDLIMLEIGVMRANAEKRKVLVLIDDLDKKIKREYDVDEDMRDMAGIQMWHSQLNSLRAALPALSKEHLEYQTRKDQKLRDLKATRDLRFKHIEESKKNIFELIKDLDSHKKRKQEGRFMELMKMAGDKVEKVWQDSLEFEDGTYNTPFLSPEGILAQDRIEIDREVFDELLKSIKGSRDEDLINLLRSKGVFLEGDDGE